MEFNQMKRKVNLLFIVLCSALLALVRGQDGCSVIFYSNSDGTGTAWGPFGAGFQDGDVTESNGLNDAANSMVVSAPLGHVCSLTGYEHWLPVDRAGLEATWTVDGSGSAQDQLFTDLSKLNGLTSWILEETVTAIVCVDEDCNDTNVCNGVETCVNGECVSPNDFGECGLNFICDPIEGCVRDCDTLAIDGYLRDCSEEFDTIKTEGAELVATVDAAVSDIADLQTDLEAVADGVGSLGSELGSTQSDVSTLQSDLSSLSTNVGSIASNVASITSELTDLVARLKALEDFVGAFGPSNARGENSKNSFSAAAHSFAFDDFSSNGNDNGFNLNWAQVAGVVLLVLVTVVLCAYNFCGTKGKGAKKGYRAANQYASEDERVSVQLKNGH